MCLVCLSSVCEESGTLQKWVIKATLSSRKVVTQRRSIAKNVGCFQLRLFVCLWVCAFVCLCVCMFVNTITSRRVNMGWWNLGVGALYKSLGQVRLWGLKPLPGGVHPQKCGFDYDVGKISAGCLVSWWLSSVWTGTKYSSTAMLQWCQQC